MFNRSQVSIGRDSRPNHSIGITLLLLVRTTYTWVLFVARIPFVVNRTFNTIPTERLQQHKVKVTSKFQEICRLLIVEIVVLEYIFDSDSY